MVAPSALLQQKAFCGSSTVLGRSNGSRVNAFFKVGCPPRSPSGSSLMVLLHALTSAVAAGSHKGAEEGGPCCQEGGPFPPFPPKPEEGGPFPPQPEEGGAFAAFAAQVDPLPEDCEEGRGRAHQEGCAQEVCGHAESGHEEVWRRQEADR